MSTASDTLLPARDVLVLSPHLDDAVLSTSAFVLNRPCDVWTVFAGRPTPPQRTAWEETCGFADSDEAITVRWAEDEAAFAGSPARARRLDAWEGPYASRERRRDDLRRVRAEVERWLAERDVTVILIPAGAGVRVPDPWWQKAVDRVRPAASQPEHADAAPDDADRAPQAPSSRTTPTQRAKALARGPVRLVQRAMHADHVRRRRRATAGGALAPNPDHIGLRDMVLDLAAERAGTRVALYEELPYLWHGRADDEVARICTERGLDASSLSLDVDVQQKFAHLQHYRSQMPVMDTRGRLLAAEHLPSCERYWVLSPSPTPN